MAIQTQGRLADYEALAQADLVALARDGHRQAFRVIMQRANQHLFRVARAIVRDESEAEDILQEAYARAFAKLDTFRGDAAILTWLTRITINEARGRLRSRKPTVDVGRIDAERSRGGEVVRFPNLADADPEATAARSQLRRLIERAVDDLPEAFRVVFVMRDVEECTIEETADQMNLRPETVKTRLHRARRLLRKALHAELSASLNDTFPFLGARCERITQKVLTRLAATGAVTR